MGGRVARAVRAWPGVVGVSLLAVGASLLAPPAPAAAHNQLTGSDPRDGARVAAAPQRIELRFLSRLDPATTKVTVTGPDNVAAAGGAASFSGSRVTVPFRPGRAGLYIVGYQVRSGDGHPVSGEVRFTLTTGTPADPSATPTPATPSAVASPPVPATPTPSGSPAATAREDDGGTTRTWLWLALAAAALAVTGATAAFLRRRRTR
ncbi:copper resistance CopC family protein [Micromonospora sp. NPDC126480]|uniref:copper resistance CopC family protein n=1 Tax=Micromonospora sp. NPDC126480 TaxID=3155312 RepID=UPI00331AC912